MARTALVTGASAGLGAEYAKLFAADGHDVILVARRRDRLEALAEEIRKAHHVQAHVVVADLAASDGVAHVVEGVRRLGVEIEFLVNNAGFGASGAFAHLDPARNLGMVQVNVAAPVALTGAFLPGMIARKHGRILNVGSTAGFQPGPFMAVYYASKAFVNSFTEALAHELRGTGVTATVTCPGPTATEFARVAGDERAPLFRKRWRALQGVAPALDVAREGYLAMMAGRPMAVHGFKNKVIMQSLRVSPRAVVRAVTARLNTPQPRSTE
jgi:short-subunit dehydrogenase